MQKNPSQMDVAQWMNEWMGLRACMLEKSPKINEHTKSNFIVSLILVRAYQRSKTS